MHLAATRRSPIRLLCAPLLAAALMGCSDAERVNPVRNAVAGELLVLKKNGGWCWFQDERAIVDGDRILIGTVAGTTGEGSTYGDIEVTSFDLAARASTTFKLHEELQGDDHDAPSLLRLADGRFLAMYTRHGSDRLMRWRVSSAAGDATAWEPEETLRDAGARKGVTYSNTFVLPAENDRVYNLYRGEDHNPHLMIAPAAIPDFEIEGRLLRWDKTAETGADPAKITGIYDKTSPYVRYVSNGLDTIHFVSTEDHPRAYDNSLYYGFVRGGAVYDGDGAVVDQDLSDEEAASPVDLTRVYEGDADHVAWPADIELDRDGHPVIAFSVQRGGAATRDTAGEGGDDHRFYYARFDGAAWRVHEMAHAGRRLYAKEDDYTGLVALDPRDPDTVYFSTDVDPVTGEPLEPANGRRHHEIFRGRTADLGETWTFTPITQHSTHDNLRPTIPRWEGHTALLWLRGKYKTMNYYDQDVVGIIDP